MLENKMIEMDKNNKIVNERFDEKYDIYEEIEKENLTLKDKLSLQEMSYNIGENEEQDREYNLIITKLYSENQKLQK